MILKVMLSKCSSRSKPVPSSILISSNTSSGLFSRMALIPEATLFASPTIFTSGQYSFSKLFSVSLTCVSSSMISVRDNFNDNFFLKIVITVTNSKFVYSQDLHAGRLVYRLLATGYRLPHHYNLGNFNIIPYLQPAEIDTGRDIFRIPCQLVFPALQFLSQDFRYYFAMNIQYRNINMSIIC